MRSADLESILRRLHGRPVRPSAGRYALADRLAARHEHQYRTGRTPIMTTLLRKPVLALLLLGLLGVAACTVPTETEVEMGQRLTYSLTPGTDSYAHADALLSQVRDVTTYVESYPGVENVSVSVMETDGGPVDLDLIVWGTGFEPAALERELAGRFPALAAADLRAESLNGTVRTSLAEKVGHEWFDISVVQGTPEEMKAAILEQIYANGFGGEADVQVSQDGDLTTIGVELTQDADGLQTEDEIVIELKDE